MLPVLQLMILPVLTFWIPFGLWSKLLKESGFRP
ncbi:MAG: hypothetical protein CLLPBCKN_007474 [Chroococcidiopsis cubana SAG 39.79]|nr:hypothetical protein [Chroococcidiopsis cubana SAG 39.79]